MTYLENMLNTEEKNRQELEEILKNENIQKLVLRAGQHIDNDTILNLRGTKALVLEFMSNTDNEFNNRESWGELLLSAHDKPMGINVTTWSSLVRNAIDVMRPQIDIAKAIVNSEEFITVFESCVKSVCEEIDFKLNANCPKRLYKEAEETDLIHSSVYMNSKNHFIPIITDEQGIVWGLCAVYTGEVVIMLEALLDTLHYMFTEYRNADDTMPYHTFVITYIHRDDIPNDQVDVETMETVEDINNEIQNLQLSKDLLQVQRKIGHINTVTMELFSDIENIQKKYGLKTLDDLLKSID